MLTPQIISPLSMWKFAARHHRTLGVISLVALALAWSPLGRPAIPGRYGAMLTARRPLVLVNGQIAQLPAGDTLSIDGLAVTSFTDTGPFALSGSISPAALAGTVNDYNPTGLSTTSLIRQDASVASTITGLTAQTSGTEIVITNISTTNTITLTNEDTGSVAANRFTLPNAASWIIPPNGALWLRYSGSSSRWRPATSGNANTNGAGSFVLSGVISPTAIAGPATVNDYNPTGLATAFTVRQDVNSGGITLTGIAGGIPGRLLQLVNLSTDSSYIQLSLENAGSLAANRFIGTSSGPALQLSPRGTAMLYYDGTLSRWRVVGFTSDYTPSTQAGNFSTNGLLASAASNLGGATSFTNVVTPTAISGANNNYAPTNIGSATTLRQDVSSAATLTGLSASTVSASADGRLLFVQNIASASTNTITLVNESASSTAANRFTLPNGANVVIPAGQGAVLRYNGSAARWYVVGNAQSTLTAETAATLTVTDTGTQNDYNPAGLSNTSVLILNNAGGLTITGLQGGQDGRIIYTCSITSSTVTFNNEAAGSTAANRFNFAGGANLVLSTNGTNKYSCVTFMYLGAQSRWIALSLPQSVQINTPIAFAGANTYAGLVMNTGSLVLSSATGHIQASGTSPTLTSCGTSPSITGSDISGRVTTGTTNTGCTLTFASTYTNTPSCVCSTENPDATFKCVPAATTLTITYASNSGNVFDYHCMRNN